MVCYVFLLLTLDCLHMIWSWFELVIMFVRWVLFMICLTSVSFIIVLSELSSCSYTKHAGYKSTQMPSPDNCLRKVTLVTCWPSHIISSARRNDLIISFLSYMRFAECLITVSPTIPWFFYDSGLILTPNSSSMLNRLLCIVRCC